MRLSLRRRCNGPSDDVGTARRPAEIAGDFRFVQITFIDTAAVGVFGYHGGAVPGS